MSVFSPSVTSSSGGTNTTFTINSFTQNLASVLSDTRRTRGEIAAFFTRHWGEQFVPHQHVPPASTIPSIGLEHFRHYLDTTARKHRQYLRARRALKRSAAARQPTPETAASISREEVPDLFFSQSFLNRDRATFESVFLEPKAGDVDKLLSTAEKQRSLQSAAQNPQALGRHESCGSLTSMISLQQPSVPVEASNGRMFRACQRLQQRLEFFDDALSALLNQQLEAKNEQFWRTIHSYGTLHADLELTIERVRLIRQKLAKSKEQLCLRSDRLLQLHYARLNRQRLLGRLHEIACLRDAQATVQMLLNQEDIGRALECIHTAQEVLGSELRGVNCFRHLGSQLEEMTRMIGKMLLEEFEALIQREFAWPIGEEHKEENQLLHHIVASLIKCGEFRFLAILREEIAGTVKNTAKQVIKGQLLICLDNNGVGGGGGIGGQSPLRGFNPNALLLSEHIVQLSDAQWTDTLRALLQSLGILCDKIMTIQTLVIKCAQQSSATRKKDKCSSSPPEANASCQFEMPAAHFPHSKNRRSSPKSVASEPTLPHQQQQRIGNGIGCGRRAKSEYTWQPGQQQQEEEDEEEEKEQASTSSNVDGWSSRSQQNDKANARTQQHQQQKFEQSKSPPPPPAASSGILPPMVCHSVAQLGAAASCLIVHAVHSFEDRIAKLLQARFKDPVLEHTSPMSFSRTCKLVEQFLRDCQQRINNSTTTTTSSATTTAAAGQLMSGKSAAHTVVQQTTNKFLTKFTESRRQQLSSAIDSEMWRPASIAADVQRMVNRFVDEGLIMAEEDADNEKAADEKIADGGGNNGKEKGEEQESNQQESLLVGQEPFTVCRTACLLITLLAQYSDLLRLFPSMAMELVMDVVQCLKLFNSRTCQLILGAGARQLVGLKTITVKHLALASRSLQLVSRFIPELRRFFADQLPADRQHLLRHFDSTARDYADHIGEIRAKLLGMMDKELIGALEEWKLEGKIPTPSFQQIVMQIGKFYSSFSSVMPPEITTEMLHLIHANFKLYFKQHLQSRGITPHDSLAFGMAGQDFSYYVENVRAFPDCKSFPDDSIGDVLQREGK